MTNVNDSYSVSSATYHTGARVKQGWGDPCKLVGLSATDIRGANGEALVNSHNSGWRLPTAKENSQFVNGTHNDYPTWQPGGTNYLYTQNTGTNHDQANYWVASGAANNPTVVSGTRYAGGWFPVIQGAAPNSSAGKFLPAAGFRNTGGTVGSQGAGGYIWSGTAQGSTTGYNLNFSNTSLYPVTNASFANGFPVRCVGE